MTSASSVVTPKPSQSPSDSPEEVRRQIFYDACQDIRQYTMSVLRISLGSYESALEKTGYWRGEFAAHAEAFRSIDKTAVAVQFDDLADALAAWRSAIQSAGTTVDHLAVDAADFTMDLARALMEQVC